MHLDDVVMLQGFQHLRLYKDAVDVGGCPHLIRPDDFDSILFSRLFVSGEKDRTESSFTQLFYHLEFAKAAGRIELLSLRSIENSFVLDVAEIIFEVLSAF